MSGTMTTTARDPVTGEVDYEYTTGMVAPNPAADDYGFGPYVITATDYDLNGDYAWSSYTIRNTLEPYRIGPSSQLYRNLLTSVEARMDDGSTVTVENDYIHFRAASYLLDQTVTVTDAAGAFAATTDTAFVPFSDAVPDYAVTRYANGRVVNTDYDAATGNLDYVYLVDPDGHTVSSDHEAATGRLDYVVERFADGRMTVTDYDLADQQPWTSYTINYDASGGIASVVVL